jgi:hypothetical protein
MITIYSAEPVTFEIGEQYADLPQFTNIEAVINLL